MDILQAFSTQAGVDVLLGDHSILSQGLRKLGEFLPIQPDRQIAFQGQVQAWVGQSAIDLGQHFLDPVPAFRLGLAVLGDPTTIQADLGTPAAASLVEVDRSFVVCSFFCHDRFSFFCAKAHS